MQARRITLGRSATVSADDRSNHRVAHSRRVEPAGPPLLGLGGRIASRSALGTRLSVLVLKTPVADEATLRRWAELRPGLRSSSFPSHDGPP